MLNQGIDVAGKLKEGVGVRSIKAAPRYTVGIDLGTTHTVVAYAVQGATQIELFEIDQLIALGEVAPRSLLPSVRYHPTEGELPLDDLQLPWPQVDVGPNAANTATAVVHGHLALTMGALVPGRLVTSAKSWLSHTAVDRTASILPWGAPADVVKVSPLAASAGYLAHVRAAWDTAHPTALLAKQDIVLTVPASFDEGARALTLEAARMAGLPQVRLIEEPQAAFYDWVHSHREALAADLGVVGLDGDSARRLLVVDVGGGTTDLTLIQVEMAYVDGTLQPKLTRTAVGDHLMLGGDNMDLALAHLVESRLAPQGSASEQPIERSNERLSAARLSQLTQRCRAAKELLLSQDAPESTTVIVLGSSAKLIGGSRSVTLTREDVSRVLVDGFFPAVASDALPQRARSGLVEFGLPYASDAAITRHIAAFVARSGTVPDTLLLNGGVFHAPALVERLHSTLNGWSAQGTSPLRLLHNPHLDAAVARGAVAYALARAGLGARIGGGSARSYFLVLDDGIQSQRGICVLPHGAQEGHEITLSDRTFALRLARPVRFYLASSVTRTAHQPGELVDLSRGNFVRLPPIATVVQPLAISPGTAHSALEVLVQLSTSLTEVGTLEMHCIALNDNGNDSKNDSGLDIRQRWRLEFQLRGDAANSATANDLADIPLPHPRLKEAVDIIDRVYGNRAQNVDAKEVQQLRPQLERLLGTRDSWDTPLLRALFAALLAGAKRRRRSAPHERLWFNQIGYALRPGFGHPLDDWRVAQLWDLFGPGIAFSREPQHWSEWWTLWRRVAGGLTAEQQDMVYEAIAYYLQPAGCQDIPSPGGPAMQGLDDMVRMAASFERMAVSNKVQFGGWLLQRLKKPTENVQSWWALGRIGARQPFYGSAHNVVPPEVAAEWLEALLAQDWSKTEPAAFAATQIARATGDRVRDVPDALRERVVQRLIAGRAPVSWVAMVREVTALEDVDEADKRRMFGESLPAGLKLVV